MESWWLSHHFSGTLSVETPYLSAALPTLGSMDQWDLGYSKNPFETVVCVGGGGHCHPDEQILFGAQS